MSATAIGDLQKYVPPHGYLNVKGCTHVVGDRSCGALHADPREPCTFGGIVRPASIHLGAKPDVLGWDTTRTVQVPAGPLITKLEVIVVEYTAEQRAERDRAYGLYEAGQTAEAARIITGDDVDPKVTLTTTDDLVAKPVSTPTVFEGHDVMSPAGRYIVVRVLMWAGAGRKWTTPNQARAAWNHVKARRPEFVSLSLTNSTGRRGAPADTLDEEGMYQLLMALECEKAAEFRAKAAAVVRQVRAGDLAPRAVQASLAPASDVDDATANALRDRLRSMAPRMSLRQIGQAARILKALRR